MGDSPVMFDATFTMPHGHCYLWRPDVLWLNVGSDALIGFSYFFISLALFYYKKKANHKNPLIKLILFSFVCFILLCGATHIISIWTVWHPDYYLEGFVKLLTSIASLGTALILWPQIPKILDIPSIDSFKDLNKKLQDANINLEKKIADATTQLQTKSSILEAILHSLSEGIIYTDPNSKKIILNSSAAKLLDTKELDFSDLKNLTGSFEMMDEKKDTVLPMEERPLYLALKGQSIKNKIYRFKNILKSRLTYVEINSNPVNIHQEKDIVGAVATLRDITDARLAEKKFEIIFDKTPNGLLIVDAHGKIDNYNIALKNMFGYNDKELLNQDFSKLFSLKALKLFHKNTDSTEELIQLIGSIKNFEISGLKSNNEELPLEVFITPITDELLPQLFVSMRDLTDRNSFLEHLEMQEQLKKENYALEMTNKFKSQFISNVSHEVRNPLNSILLLTKSLLEPKDNLLTKTQKECLEMIHSSSKDLHVLVSDLLDHEKIEKGIINIRVQKIYISEFIDRNISLFNLKCKEKNLNFQLNVHCSREDFIHTDRFRTEQVFRNIMMNAIKFTNTPGDIHLDIDIIQNEKDTKTMVIKIKDSGSGIETKSLDLIFNRFKRLEQENHKDTEGYGIGLSISRQLLNLLQGKVEVNSKVGVGSTFTIYIPTLEKYINEKKLKKVVSKEKLILSKDEIKALSKAVVLIVDDDVRNVFAMRKILLQNKIKTHNAQNGHLALDLIKKFPDINVIIMDIMMPEMDGFESTERIQKEFPKRNISVIAISGHLDLKKDDYHKRGFFEFQEKPVDVNKLIQQILAAVKSLLTDI